MIAVFVSFGLAVVGLAYSWVVIYRQQQRERERFTQKEIRRIEDRAA